LTSGPKRDHDERGGKKERNSGPRKSRTREKTQGRKVLVGGGQARGEKSKEKTTRAGGGRSVGQNIQESHRCQKQTTTGRKKKAAGKKLWGGGGK